MRKAAAESDQGRLIATLIKGDVAFAKRCPMSLYRRTLTLARSERPRSEMHLAGKSLVRWQDCDG